MNPPKPKELSAKQKPLPANEAARLSSTELFQGRSRLVIEHGGNEYLLQITRQGKLILTK